MSDLIHVGVMLCKEAKWGSTYESEMTQLSSVLYLPWASTLRTRYLYSNLPVYISFDLEKIPFVN